MTKRTSLGPCQFEGCDNDAIYHHLQCCNTCYSGLRTWRDRSAQALKNRQQQLERLTDRLDYVAGKNPLPEKKG
jgi:hypothetical protein